MHLYTYKKVKQFHNLCLNTPQLTSVSLIIPTYFLLAAVRCSLVKIISIKGCQHGVGLKRHSPKSLSSDNVILYSDTSMIFLVSSSSIEKCMYVCENLLIRLYLKNGSTKLGTLFYFVILLKFIKFFFK